MDAEHEQWEKYYLKENLPATAPIHIHKVAPVGTTYRFCVRNSDPRQKLIYSIRVCSGLELMDLHLLPDNSDA